MVTLNPETHIYTDDRGMIVPGVTGVIEHLCDYAGIPAHVLDHKSQLGTAVHRACELYDLDDLDWDSVDDSVLPYLNSWIKFLGESGFEITNTEQLVFHPRHRYAGTLDRAGWFDNQKTIADIKATAVVGPHVGIQLAAYQEAYNIGQKDSGKATKRMAVQLKPDGNYKIHHFADKSDFSVFLGQLTIYNWRQKHGKLIDCN